MSDRNEILNWRELNEKITLSGQPSEAELVSIKKMGASHIINLGPHSHKDALENEAASVAALGMEYIYIPVDFQNPTEENFSEFCNIFEKLQGSRIHVHCIYNARVTAFIYRHAKEYEGIDEIHAHEIMDGIWRPGGVWAKFIGNDSDIELADRYAGNNS